jgi:voltage-gated sodium channel
MVILANVVYLGVQASLDVSNEFRRLKGQTVEDGPWQVLDAIFCTIFVAEMMIRMVAEQRMFFAGKERYWNLFDSCIVASSVVESAAAMVAISTVSGVSALRTFRILRIIRLLRVTKVFAPCRAIIRTLQTILHSLSGSITSFVSALLMLFIFLYIFGLSFMQGVKGFLANASAADQATTDFKSTAGRMEEFYGSMGATLWTLLGAVTGGYDWADVAQPIAAIGPFYKLGFLVYILFVFFALLNVLTGIFVNVAMDSCAMNREIAIDAAITNKENIVKEVVDLFQEADKDRSGSLSWEEFEEYIQDEKIRAFFMALDLDVSSARRIFSMLDTSQDGELEIHEFVQGCINLRGGAKKIDISLLENESSLILTKLKRIEVALHL